MYRSIELNLSSRGRVARWLSTASLLAFSACTADMASGAAYGRRLDINATAEEEDLVEYAEEELDDPFGATEEEAEDVFPEIRNGTVDTEAEAASGIGPYSKYIALGDSFSSANGVLDAERDVLCRWGDGAWPKLLAPNLKYDGTAEPNFDSAACSGARTTAISGTQSIKDSLEVEIGTKDPQIDKVKSAAGLNSVLITITVGGNDADVFTEMLTCGLDDCLSSESTIMGKIAALQPKLEGVYKAIKAAASKATVVAVGYPHLLAIKADETCTKQVIAGLPVEITLEEREMMARAVDRMNTTIAAAAKEAKIQWITSEIVSVFEGHEACAAGGASWIWTSGVGDDGQALGHPNADGNRAYADAVLKALRKLNVNSRVTDTTPGTDSMPGSEPLPGESEDGAGAAEAEGGEDVGDEGDDEGYPQDDEEDESYPEDEGGPEDDEGYPQGDEGSQGGDDDEDGDDGYPQDDDEDDDDEDQGDDGSEGNYPEEDGYDEDE